MGRSVLTHPHPGLWRGTGLSLQAPHPQERGQPVRAASAQTTCSSAQGDPTLPRSLMCLAQPANQGGRGQTCRALRPAAPLYLFIPSLQLPLLWSPETSPGPSETGLALCGRVQQASRIFTSQISEGQQEKVPYRYEKARSCLSNGVTLFQNIYEKVTPYK